MARILEVNFYNPGATILDLEYFIHKAATASSKGLSVAEIHSMLKQDGLSEEQIYLVIAAGKILYFDWNDDDEEPTKPDRKITPLPSKLV
jgi:hypothetical protein